MRQRFRGLWAIVAALLLLSACFAGPAEEGAVLFYYQDAQVEYGTEDGVLGSEPHRFPQGFTTYTDLLNLYFGQPQDQDLRSPFPKELRCLETTLTDRRLTVRLSDAYDGLNGLDRAIVAACITMTLTQFDDVSEVCLETARSAGAEPVVYTARDFVCQELGAVNTETAVRLYFSDANGRYLVSAERKNYFSDPAQIPSYILQQLIDGPTEEGQLAVMPEGAAVRSLTVGEDGECVVDFSSEFYLNRPATELLERMTILSLVNSLTELDTISSVRILVEGQPVETYLRMNLDQALVRDESAIDVVRPGLNEIDATLYVCGWHDSALAAVPISVRETAQETPQEALLEALTGFQPINGLTNPLPDGVQVQRVEQENGVCHVDLSKELLRCAGDADQEQLAVRSITATLTSLDDVSFVKLSVDGSYEGFRYCPLDHLYRANDSWFS